MARRQRIYDEIVTAHYPALLAYAEALGGGAADGEDLLADAFPSALAWPRVVRSVEAGEFAVRVSLARKAARRRPAATGADAEHGAPADPAFAALAALSPGARVAVVLHHHDGLAVEEVASRMRTSSARAARLLAEGEASAAAALGVEVGEGGERTVVAAHGRRR